MGAFEDAYKQLNEKQKQAVDKIDGPVLVVAGPGTGKTQLLSMRVANILKKTDTEPGNILCLTFTNKAALNMRERVIQLTDGTARNVMIKTFHSFAAELMNMFPDSFWNGARLTTAPDAVQNEIIQNILTSLPIDNPLAQRFAGQFTVTNDIKNSLRLAKEAGLTPAKLEALINANLAFIDIIEPNLIDILSPTLRSANLSDLIAAISDLPEQGIGTSLAPLTSLSSVIKDSFDFAVQQDEGTGKTSNTGKCKQRFIQTQEGQKGMFKERERNHWWMALAGVYKQYRNELHQRGYYDYSDMIVEVISVLESNASTRADAQERFQYVLIDEFQDTNAAQMRLAHLIADHYSNEGKPNLMVVGDDDQSIYKFNGAELANMLSFQKSYPSTELIVLEENYRSTQAILDASAKVITGAKDRLVARDPSITKDLVAVKNTSAGGKLKHYSYANQADELHQVTKAIKQQFDAGEHSVAVLARGNSSLRQLSSLLLASGVPVSYQEQSNILEHQLVQQVYIVSSLLVAIHAGDITNVNYLLSKTLAHPMWDIAPTMLWQLATANKKGNNWLDELLVSEDIKLKTIALWLVWLAKTEQHEPLPIIIEYILGLRAGEHMTGPFKKYFIDKIEVTNDYLHGLSAIRLLQDLVNEFARLSSGTIEDFVTFIRLNIETEEVIADETSFVSGDNAVELLTVHKAKGLEFDTVYIIDALDNNWSARTTGRKAPANLPLQPAFDDSDDYARLMYVAFTRAKRSIIVASYREDTRGKEVLATPLIHDALTLEEIPAQPQDERIEVLEESLTWPRLHSSDELRMLTPRLESFTLSASSLLSLLDVSRGGPNNFLGEYLLRLPGASTTSMAFGIAIHSALEYAQIITNNNTYSLTAITQRYESSLQEQFLPRNEQDRFLTYGVQLLTSLLNSKTLWFPKHSLPEQLISDVTLVDSIRLKGKIDRIDTKDTHLIIVDYKTGKPLSSFITKDQTKAIKAWRHRTQLTFYALLIKHSQRYNKYKDIIGQMIYVEAAEPKALIREYTPTDDDISRLERLIAVIWPKIQSLNLPDTRNYSPDYSGIVQFEQDMLEGLI